MSAYSNKEIQYLDRRLEEARQLKTRLDRLTVKMSGQGHTHLVDARNSVQAAVVSLIQAWSAVMAAKQ